MTAVKSEKGRIQGFLSAGRLLDEDEHSLSFSEHEGGVIRFLCDSEYGDTFTGNDGEIATLLVNISETMADGDYPIVMKDMKLSEVDIVNYYLADDVETTVTIGEAAIVYTVLDETSPTFLMPPPSLSTSRCCVLSRAESGAPSACPSP